MPFENFLIDATEIVLSWNISDDALSGAVVAQASFMAGVHPEDMEELYLH